MFRLMNRKLAALLALLIAFAPFALAIPATSMTAQMAMSGNVEPADCCPGTNGDHSACPTNCANAISLATIPCQFGLVSPAIGHEVWRRAILPLLDHPQPPDPPPPKAASLH